jgi:hypothetical protein
MNKKLKVLLVNTQIYKIQIKVNRIKWKRNLTKAKEITREMKEEDVGCEWSFSRNTCQCDKGCMSKIC